MIISNTDKYIKDFERKAIYNPLHDNLLSYLRMYPVKSINDLESLVVYMQKNQMLEDYKCYIYILYLFSGTHFQKDFMRLAKNAGYKGGYSTEKKKDTKETEQKSSSHVLKKNKEEMDIDAFVKTLHFLDWNHVRKGKKAYVFKPLFDTVEFEELILKPTSGKLVDIKGLSFFYKWLPTVRFRVDEKMRISQFEFSAFAKALEMCAQLQNLLGNPERRKELMNIHQTNHILDWNHVVGSKDEYLIEPKVFGFKIKGISIPRKFRPIAINITIKKHLKELPDITYQIDENFKVTNFNIELFEEAIDFCLGIEKQRVLIDQQLYSEEKRRIAEEQEKRRIINEENRKRKLQETYDRLQQKGVDLSVFSSKLTLQWADVKFYHRYFIFEPQLGKRIGENKVSPLRVDDYRCRPSFNYILTYFQNRLPKISYILTTDFKVKLGSKPLFETALADLTKEQARLDAGVDITPAAGRVISVVRRSFDSAMSKAASMTPEDFRRYKSKFIDFLVGHQSADYKVVPVSENVVHSRSRNDEASFIFTAKSWDDHLFIVIENIHPDRSTLLFKVRRDMYRTALHTLFDFMQSDVINKRSSIRDGELKLDHAGVIYYCTFNHDSYTDWMYRLRSYLR